MATSLRKREEVGGIGGSPTRRGPGLQLWEKETQEEGQVDSRAVQGSQKRLRAARAVGKPWTLPVAACQGPLTAALRAGEP